MCGNHRQSHEINMISQKIVENQMNSIILSEIQVVLPISKSTPEKVSGKRSVWKLGATYTSK